MHKTTNGEKQTLYVRMYPDEAAGSAYIFCDKYEEYNSWVNDEIECGKFTIEKTAAFKDINYLLNSMVKAKGTRWGNILFEIYIDNYKQDDQMDRVIKFWKS